METPKQLSDSPNYALQVGRLVNRSHQEAPYRFAKLFSATKHTPGSLRIKGQVKTALERVKEQKLESQLTLLLAQSLGKSVLRQPLIRIRRTHAAVAPRVISSLKSAAEGLRKLAELDKESAHMAQLVSGHEAAEAARVRGEWKLDRGNRLDADAHLLEEGLQAIRKAFSDRRWGVFGKYGNSEWVFQLREWFHNVLALKISYEALAFLLRAAWQAWESQEKDLHGDSLRKTIARFAKRNPDLVKTFREAT